MQFFEEQKIIYIDFYQKKLMIFLLEDITFVEQRLGNSLPELPDLVHPGGFIGECSVSYSRGAETRLKEGLYFRLIMVRV